MKIDAMIIREDFYSINEKTLEDYYKNVHGFELKISTLNYSIFNEIFIYPKINAIVTRYPSKKVLKYIFSEFNVRNNKIKYYLGKLYTAACLLTGGLFSSKALKCYNFNPLNNNILIWPCNRKIRIFDFKNNTVDSIVKESFTKKYFNNEVSFRLNSTYSFVPAILAHGENWYREPLLEGQPLARITDNKQYERSCNDAIIFLKTIADSSIKFVEAVEYAEKLFNKVDTLIDEAKDKKKITTGDNVRVVAKTAYRKAILIQNKIPLVLSHGDLQSGNLWVDIKNRKTFIIDWETNDLRSIWYDPTTLLLSTRRHNGVLNMVTNCQSETVKNAVLVNDTMKEYDMDAIMGILVLEDIIFYLEDNLELQQDWGGDLIDRYGRQLMQLKWGKE